MRSELETVTPENIQRIWMSLGLIAAAVVVLGIGVWYYRRWYRSDGPTNSSWTLEDFRKMRDRGELTEAEFQRLRASVLGQVQGIRPTEPASVKPGGSGNANLARRQGDKGQNEDGKNDASGDTVWSFDLKKTPPG